MPRARPGKLPGLLIHGIGRAAPSGAARCGGAACRPARGGIPLPYPKRYPAELEIEATPTSKGWGTIPEAVRDALHLRTAGRLDFILGADGAVRMLPIPGSVKRLKGMLPKPVPPVTLEEIEQALCRRAGGRARYRRPGALSHPG